MKFKHVSMVARDADGLADFYQRIFGCNDRRPRKTLAGDKVSRGNGLPNSEICSAWLTLPGVDGPFLKILEYGNMQDRPTPLVDEPGYGHISFEVEDIQATVAAVIQAGGKPLGEITDFGTAEAPCLIVYVRDPEGNIVELEQRCNESRQKNCAAVQRRPDGGEIRTARRHEGGGTASTSGDHSCSPGPEGAR